MARTYKDPGTYRKTVLDNGIRIITEELPYLNSVSLGVWIRSGSRFETLQQNGICHFIEHMLFKGTGRRSALDIAKEMDSVGGALNAFTGKEFTAFDCRVLDEHLELAVDLVTDIFLNPSFPEDELERERQVIVQEICQLEDAPEELVHELLFLEFWRDDPLGRPILGTIPSVSGIDRDALVAFKLGNYSACDTVVAAAGKLDHDHFVELVARGMSVLANGTPRKRPDAAVSCSSARVVESDLEQVHVCIAANGPSALDDRRHAGYVLNAVLGGGWSSKLFQEVREKRGLAYAVYSFLSTFSDTGMLGVYAGCDPARLDELLGVVGRETSNLAAHITEDEVATAKSQIRGNLILSMESAEARMNRLARGEYYYGRRKSLQELLSALEAVTIHDVARVAEELIGPDRMTLVALGPVKESTNLSALFWG